MIESIEKLRKSSHLDDEKWTLSDGRVMWIINREPDDPNAVNWGESWRKIADEIEREIAEHYILLPVDADGVPIRVGDEINCLGRNVLVNSIIWDGVNWYASETVVSSNWFPAKHSGHAKPRTLEDVLEEFAYKAVRIGMVGGVPCDAEIYADKDAIAEYAAKIRELMVVDE